LIDKIKDNVYMAGFFEFFSKLVVATVQ